ncbi:hypothetical protein [Pseudokordiimonas caeni]|uniref:hypothetical protein n=1 Tax=Pseudokordiimonas caeni TaxID=2997908 RepID=UPI002811320C|nr:hypothetical protein [Pseudokordiimonas caeni]
MSFYLILAAATALVIVLIHRQQEPRRPLKEDEIMRFRALAERVVPDVDPVAKADFLKQLDHFMAADDGRDIYMLNLLRFHDAVTPGEGIDPVIAETPAKANAHYEKHVMPIALKRGCFAVFAGSAGEANVMGTEPAAGRYDRVIVMHYPSRRHFLKLVTDPAYKPLAPYKLLSMHVDLVPLKRDIVVPDFRTLGTGLALIAFFAIAWLHAL